MLIYSLLAGSACCIAVFWWFFFFSSRRRHTRFDCDWSSDVCSSDLQQDVRCHGAGDRPRVSLLARAPHHDDARAVRGGQDPGEGTEALEGPALLRASCDRKSVV